ncbi:aminotransferase class III-fold pyridoxal phosphate-dependent enzyme [Nocardioides zeae]|uniref:Aminotransferase class III-fold pyridoxal phosphate-dependent enzyme n=1 Tax=Nocardioides imazamoxiresistens TaxID=3231893 RepID=A0ABU3PUF5_9ACTN|nr:aminotransferase class III-fold pyridoxal phosphate-dependent enzyme [Nocardioides zeae]MDT9592858.1 aminotransferase class III-fold pyridoxal phosphate-dependent enzyme [Nocardioides zeae]
MQQTKNSGSAPTTSSILDANAYQGRGADGTLVRRRADVLASAYRLFYREPVQLVRGSGVHLYDADGAEYLDAYNNVAAVGHAHPRVAAAVARQVATLTTHTRYLDAGLVGYAERLLATMPAALDRLVLTCTGSEANDLALRAACAVTGGTGVIVSEEAYHGNTALVTGVSPSLGPGAPRGEHVWRVPVREMAAAVAEALAEMSAAGVRPAALLVDTVLSSDGVHPDVDGLAAATTAVRAAGGVLIADEVQPGFARTGATFWGFERHGLDPELVTMGKPMGNGLPVAGLAGRRSVLDALAASTPYFNTFGGTHVSIAAASAVLDVIEDEQLQANAARVGHEFLTALREVAARRALVGEVRGAGLYLGVDLRAAPGVDEPGTTTAADVINLMRRRRVLTSVCGPHGSTLKVRPPLPFSSGDVDRFCTELDAVLGELEAAAG